MHISFVDGSCQQDWFAVCSILENVLGVIKAQKPNITKAFLRSDEAGCYHNNNLRTAVKMSQKEVELRSVGLTSRNRSMVKMFATRYYVQ